MPLPDEDDDDDDEERDLILDARDILVAGRLEREGDEDVKDDEQVANLPAPLDRMEILAEQKTDEYCQMLLAEQVGRKSTIFFEDDDGVLCRQNLREPGHDQVVLPASLRPRVLRLAHYHVQAGHPGANAHAQPYPTPVQLAADVGRCRQHRA